MTAQDEPDGATKRGSETTPPARKQARRHSARSAGSLARSAADPASDPPAEGGENATSPAGRIRHMVSLPHVEATSNTLRAVLLNLSFFVAFFLILPALATQLWKNQVVIEPISVPPALAQMGLMPEVAANRIWDGLLDFAKEAQTAKATFVAVPQGRSLDFSLSQSGLSVNSVMSQLRQFLNLFETHISGEFVCASPACEPARMRLRLRVLRDSATIVDLPEIGQMPSRDYFRLAAEGVFNELDPFVSIAALARSEPERALVLARQLVRTRHPDARWAQNLVGEIDMSQGRHAEALAEFESALAIEPEFLEAKVNRALALAHLGRFEEADKQAQQARSGAPDSVAVSKALASIAYMRGDRQAAVGYFLRSATLDPGEPRHLVLAGRTELELGQKEAGEAHLKEALAVAPGNPEALEALGNLYYGNYGDQRQLDSAVAMYRDWAQYDPQNAQAWFSLGNAQVATQRYEEALAAYDRAIALGETSDRIMVVRAGALMGLALSDERPLSAAISAFEALEQAAPPVPAVFLSLGKLYARSGENDKALAAYRRFLEIAPIDHDQRAFVEEEISRLQQ